jgi:hypothetical protein
LGCPRTWSETRAKKLNLLETAGRALISGVELRWFFSSAPIFYRFIFNIMLESLLLAALSFSLLFSVKLHFSKSEIMTFSGEYHVRAISFASFCRSDRVEKMQFGEKFFSLLAVDFHTKRLARAERGWKVIFLRGSRMQRRNTKRRNPSSCQSGITFLEWQLTFASDDVMHLHLISRDMFSFPPRTKRTGIRLTSLFSSAIFLFRFELARCMPIASARNASEERDDRAKIIMQFEFQ